MHKAAKFLLLISLAALCFCAQPENEKPEQVETASGIKTEKFFEIGLDGYKILQAPNITVTQMMSYLVITPNNKLVVIDGGMPGDAAYLTEKIHEAGSVVSMWIVTHVHRDHYGALAEILQQPNLNGITIEKLAYYFPPAEWIYETEPQGLPHSKNFLELLPQFSEITQILQEKEKYMIDGMVIDILKVPTDYNDYDPTYRDC